MTLDNQRILSLFALFTDMPDAELSEWKSLCVSAEEKLMSRLRKKVSIYKNMERLCSAAAAIAYCDYIMLSAGSSSEDIKVGDISLKSSGETRDAISTRDYMLAEIADLIETETGFVFRSTGDNRSTSGDRHRGGGA